MSSPYVKFSKTKFFKFVVYNDDSPKNQDTPFLSLKMASQHKIVFTKVSIYVGLVVLYLLSFLTIGIN